MEGMAGLKGKAILVTGGTGFIGGHLVQELLKGKAKVIVIDIELNPLSVFILDKLGKKVKLELVDIRDRKKVFKVFSKYSPDFVFHLAAQTTVPRAHRSPYETLETNIMGTINVLEASRLSSTVKGIIIASSDKAYGKTNRPYTEDFPLRGDHPYNVSKSSADLISQAYYKTYNTPVVITRFGNVYGEGDFHFDRIVPGICEAIIKKKTLVIRSNGKYVRDYIYVKDVADGYIFLLKKISSICGEAYNFSSNDTLSVIELVNKVETILNVKIPYKILNTAQNEIPYQHLDDTKIKKLGWIPQSSLDNSLSDVFLWYSRILK